MRNRVDPCLLTRDDLHEADSRFRPGPVSGLKVPLATALVEGIPCDCWTCRGRPAFNSTTIFVDLVLTGLEAVPHYPEALNRLNELARCRDVKEVLAIDDADDLAKEAHFTVAANQVDRACKQWAAIIAFAVRLKGRSYWADLLVTRIQASEDAAWLRYIIERE
jgi:hypothetical protein